VIVWPCVRLCVGVGVGWGFGVGVDVCASIGGQALSHERDVDRRGAVWLMWYRGLSSDCLRYCAARRGAGMATAVTW
jgi:hypothetical protein